MKRCWQWLVAGSLAQHAEILRERRRRQVKGRLGRMLGSEQVLVPDGYARGEGWKSVAATDRVVVRRVAGFQ